MFKKSFKLALGILASVLASLTFIGFTSYVLASGGVEVQPWAFFGSYIKPPNEALDVAVGGDSSTDATFYVDVDGVVYINGDLGSSANRVDNAYFANLNYSGLLVGDDFQSPFNLGDATGVATTTIQTETDGDFTIDTNSTDDVLVLLASGLSSFGTSTPYSQLTVWGSGNLLELVADTGSTTVMSVDNSGIISSATWQGNTVEVTYGGTGSTTLTGILKGNGTSQIQSAVADTDYQVPLTFGDGLTRTLNDIDCDTADTSTFGCLSAANWNTFNNKWDLASSTIGAAYGGTGSTTLSGILKGNGTGVVATAVAGTDYILTEVDPVWVAVSGDYLLIADAFTQAVASTTFSGLTVNNTFTGDNTFFGLTTLGQATTTQMTLTDIWVDGIFYDSNGSAGALGEILSSTLTGNDWIATSTLNIAMANLTGFLDLTSQVTGALPDGNISSATTWNNKWDLASSTIGVAYGGTGSTTLTGILNGDGTSAIKTAVASDFPTLNQNTTGTAVATSDSTWTLHNSYPATCTNQFIRALSDTNTCASVATTDFASANVSQWTNDSGYATFAYPFPSSATSSPLSFTGLLTIANASTTLASFDYASSTEAYFGTGYFPNLIDPAGTFVAVDGITGELIATSTPGGGGGSGTVTSIATTYPISGGTITETGTLSLSDMATTTLTATSPIAVSNTPFVIGGTGAVISLDTSGTWTGLAGTATALATARAINGTNFDGTAPITITAATSTLLADINVWAQTQSMSITGNAGTVTGFTPASGSLTLAGADAVTITTTGVTNSTLPLGTKTLVATDVATLSSLTSVGALASGSIASAFGAINNGASGITATGAIDFGGATFELPQNQAATAIGMMDFDTTDFQIQIATTTADSVAVIPTMIKLFAGGLASTSPDLVSGGILPTSPQRDGFTVREIHCIADGGTSVVINLSNVAGSTDSETVTCDTNGATDIDITTNPVYAQGSFNRIEIGTVTGAVDYFTYSVWGHITPE